MLTADAAQIRGGLLVLGSIHTEMMALLEHRSAPLYNRVTDELDLTHLDIASLLDLLHAHADSSPERLLFLWNLFEGVPKFYRDCYEQGVLRGSRRELLERAFFLSSSPLRTEADNWFLKELHGRYDVVLKFVARNPGCLHGELVECVRQISPETGEQIGGYLKILIEKYRLVEKKLPIFAREKAKRSRYYVADNFLRSWLAALASPISAINFVPADRLVAQADERLAGVEGHSFEKLVGTLYEERSRKGIGDFPLSERIRGYWDRADTEIDLVALNGGEKRVRFGSCKRNPDRLLADVPVLDGHVRRFMAEHPQLEGWRVEKISFAPAYSEELRAKLVAAGHLTQDLNDLTAPLTNLRRQSPP